MITTQVPKPSRLGGGNDEAAARRVQAHEQRKSAHKLRRAPAAAPAAAPRLTPEQMRAARLAKLEPITGSGLLPKLAPAPAPG